MNAPALMLGALLLDTAIGWPDAFFRRIRHPVVWLGALIAWLDRRWNRPQHAHGIRYALGGLAALFCIAVAVVAALVVGLAGPVAELIAAGSLVAARSLHAHVAAVRNALHGSLTEARAAISHIVGRDPATLDAPAVTRAATESLAENLSDGVIAPLFWGAMLGLPGIAAYKAVNTLDSMIGHRTRRHLAFGGVAARLDDVANWAPARLTAMLIALVALSPAALRAIRRDARRHRSPNAGWPEAAMAGALGVRLSGPRTYAGCPSAEPWLNEAGRDPDAADLTHALALSRRAIISASLLLAILAWIAR